VNFIDPTWHMVNAPGLLWIDTFIRKNFTSDTNAMFVYLLKRFAAVETFVGNSTGANAYLRMAEGIIQAMNTWLWDPVSNDHYLTQINPDRTTRDFVDYDSQLLAVAFGVCPPERIASVLRRVDSGPCTHARATWVSEKYYNTSDCNLGNTGDSAVTMGRIGWVDGLSRKVSGDVATFNRLLQPLQDDLHMNTWMYERYQCDGLPTHNSFYIEYPELIAMLLRSIRYGIMINLTAVTIDPLGVDNFTYHVGNVHVTYSKNNVVIQVVPSAPHIVQIYHLHPNTLYLVVSFNSQTQQRIETLATTNSQGTLTCPTPFGTFWTITVNVFQ